MAGEERSQTRPKPYASLLVQVDTGAHARNRLALAFDLARRFSAHVMGAATNNIPFPAYTDGPGLVAAEAVEVEGREIARQLAQAEAMFREAAGSYPDSEWRSATGPALVFFLAQLQGADLAIVGNRQAFGRAPTGMFLDPGDAVLSAGRPVLVVPPGVSRMAATKIVVAWKETREARRVLLDSLPFLQAAQEVHLAVVGERPREHGLRDVCALLGRHGVKCRVAVQPAVHAETGQEIIDIATELGADLIVAGAYGHSRVHEWVLGGVTRYLLHHAPICCLLSH